MDAISLSDIKKQVALLQIAERYFDSVVLFALFETGVFGILSSGPKTFDEIHSHVRGDEESLRATLDASVALGVLTLREGRFAGSETVLDCLGREQSPAYLGEWVAFLHALATPLLQLGQVIQTGKAPGTFFEEMEGDNSPAKRMTAAMDAYARTRGIEILDHVDFSKTRRLLDVGCGPGTYSMAIAQRYPEICATLLDLPGPIAEARQLAAVRQMTDRLEFVDVDARLYAPEKPFDTVLVSNILHLIGPRDSVPLLKRCHEWLSPGGRVILQAQFLNDDRISPRWPTLLNLTQRVASKNGRNHAISETTQWLQEAGFANIEYVRFSIWNVNSCLIGTRPLDVIGGKRVLSEART